MLMDCEIFEKIFGVLETCAVATTIPSWEAIGRHLFPIFVAEQASACIHNMLVGFPRGRDKCLRIPKAMGIMCQILANYNGVIEKGPERLRRDAENQIVLRRERNKRESLEVGDRGGRISFSSKQRRSGDKTGSKTNKGTRVCLERKLQGSSTYSNYMDMSSESSFVQLGARERKSLEELAANILRIFRCLTLEGHSVVQDMVANKVFPHLIGMLVVRHSAAAQAPLLALITAFLKFERLHLESGGFGTDHDTSSAPNTHAEVAAQHKKESWLSSEQSLVGTLMQSEAIGAVLESIGGSDSAARVAASVLLHEVAAYPTLAVRIQPALACALGQRGCRPDDISWELPDAVQICHALVELLLEFPQPGSLSRREQGGVTSSLLAETTAHNLECSSGSLLSLPWRICTANLQSPTSASTGLALTVDMPSPGLLFENHLVSAPSGATGSPKRTSRHRLFSSPRSSLDPLKDRTREGDITLTSPFAGVKQVTVYPSKF